MDYATEKRLGGRPGLEPKPHVDGTEARLARAIDWILMRIAGHGGSIDFDHGLVSPPYMAESMPDST